MSDTSNSHDTASTTGEQGSLFGSGAFAFDDRFLADHAGQIISDARISIVELVANAYDAGAGTVRIVWPEVDGGHFEISDDGTGMTPEEFSRRWKTFSYNRREEQGDEVVFPRDVRNRGARKAFGQSGKGRHGAFCFNDEYHVETRKDGKKLTVTVKWLKQSDQPFGFNIDSIVDCPKSEHGTRISGALKRNRIGVTTLQDSIGSKFIVDPGFGISINDQSVQLTDLKHLTSTKTLRSDSGDEVIVHRIDAPTHDRTTKLRGLTWWVNGKMVGQPSWEGLDKQGAVLDGRTQAAKRYSFVIVADTLNKPPHIKPDWSGFYDTQKTLDARKVVREHVINEINGILADTRKERKLNALSEQRDALKQLPRVSQKAVGQFIDEIQQKCLTLSDAELSKTVEVFTKLEQARSGYELLHKLSECSPDDLDKWNTLMEEWTADRAEIVLAEFKRRLDLIDQLQKRVHDPDTDELHELQPLFAEGLWIFGPEYDSPDFIANRQMSTVVAHLLKVVPEQQLTVRRPDFVVLPDRSLSVYTADQHGDGDVIGFRKMLILELKRGGFTLTNEEMAQGHRYALELRKSSGVLNTTEFNVFVLGSQIGDAEEMTGGKHIKVQPMCFEAVLRRAHARTFNLQKKLGRLKSPAIDQEVAQILLEPAADMFNPPSPATALDGKDPRN